MTNNGTKKRIYVKAVLYKLFSVFKPYTFGLRCKNKNKGVTKALINVK
jgi:hypothetical protein